MGDVIAWACAAHLAWMDRCVCEGNALALHQRLGFVEVGRYVDRHRVGDARRTEIAMTLALTEPSRAAKG